MVKPNRSMKRLASATVTRCPIESALPATDSTIATAAPRTDTVVCYYDYWFTSNAINIRAYAAEVDAKEIKRAKPAPTATASHTSAGQNQPNSPANRSASDGDNETGGKLRMGGTREPCHRRYVSIAPSSNHLSTQNWARHPRRNTPSNGAFGITLTCRPRSRKFWRRTASTPDHESLARATLFFARSTEPRTQRTDAKSGFDSAAMASLPGQGETQRRVMATAASKSVPGKLLPLKMKRLPSALGSYANLRDQRRHRPMDGGRAAARGK